MDLELRARCHYQEKLSELDGSMSVESFRQLKSELAHEKKLADKMIRETKKAADQLAGAHALECKRAINRAKAAAKESKKEQGGRAQVKTEAGTEQFTQSLPQIFVACVEQQVRASQVTT